MRAPMPVVSLAYREGYLWDPAAAESSIRLDTPAWFAWLEEATTTRFAYPVFDPARGYIVGRMTVRKERRQRGGTYWVGFRRCAGRVRKVYLGHSATLTYARLTVIAQTLHAAGGATQKTT